MYLLVLILFSIKVYTRINILKCSAPQFFVKLEKLFPLILAPFSPEAYTLCKKSWKHQASVFHKTWSPHFGHFSPKHLKIFKKKKKIGSVALLRGTTHPNFIQKHWRKTLDKRTNRRKLFHWNLTSLVQNEYNFCNL